MSNVSLGPVVAVVIFSDNPAQLATWYESVLTVKVVVRQPNFIGMQSGNTMLFIQQTSEGHAPGIGGIRPHFLVQNCHTAYQQLIEAGAAEILKVMDLGTEFVAAVKDPDGNPLGLLQMK